MKIDAQGWLDEARIVPSPNFNERPQNAVVNLVVIHNISLPAQVWGVDDVVAFFQNRLDFSKNLTYQDLKEVKVSSHFLLNREGDIYQFVSVFDRAWHAGVSVFSGVENCNDYSIGIELNGSDDTEFTAAQYKSLVALTQALADVFPDISMDRLVGHDEVAQPLGRKTDPGLYFDWGHYYRLLLGKTS